MFDKAKRKQVLEQAKLANPIPWNGRAVRNCLPMPHTALNPVRPSRLSEALNF